MSSCVVLVPFIVHTRAEIDEPSAFDGTDADNYSALMHVIALLCSRAYRAAAAAPEPVPARMNACSLPHVDQTSGHCVGGLTVPAYVCAIQVPHISASSTYKPKSREHCGPIQLTDGCRCTAGFWGVIKPVWSSA